MARVIGQDLAATIIARMTEQEKEAVRRAADLRGVSMSEIVRLALAEYLGEGDQK